MKLSSKSWILLVVLAVVTSGVLFCLVREWVWRTTDVNDLLVKVGLSHLPESAYGLQSKRRRAKWVHRQVFIRFQASSDDVSRFIENSASIVNRASVDPLDRLTYDGTAPAWWLPDKTATGRTYRFSTENEKIIGRISVEDNTDTVRIWVCFNPPDSIHYIFDNLGLY